MIFFQQQTDIIYTIYKNVILIANIIKFCVHLVNART